MNTTVNPNQSRAADVADIENQLRALWQEVGEQHAESSHIVTRICTLTLITYGANAALSRRVRAAVPAVFGPHPCRALLIEAEGAADELSAWVTTVCQRPGEEHEQVCCEQITITVGEQMRKRLPGTVLPLVVSDLPIFVWWPGPFHPTSNVRTQLFAHADRWIVDSADFDEPLVDLGRLADLVASDATIAVSDLNWVRLTPWRTLFAQVFDQPAWRPALDTLSEIRIVIGRHEAASLLGLGWLASCLGWTLSGASATDEGIAYRFAGPAGEVTATLCDPQKTADAQGAPAISAISREPAIALTVARGQGDRTLVADVRLGDLSRTLVGEQRPQDDGALLNEELNVYSHDRMYESALAFAARLAAAAPKA